MLDAARGWLTPAVLFVLVNLVVATIAVASWLMSPEPGAAAPVGDDAGGGRRGAALLRAPSFAVDRLRASFSFSRLGLAAADHFDYSAAAAATEEPSEPQPAPASPVETDGAGAEREREEARVERSEAAAELAAPDERRPRARKVRRAATEEPAALVAEARAAGGGRGEEPAVEVDARADDFIKRFREQLRLQRLDSILRYRDTLRRTGTA
ncbi:unnamed protein product [Urochloa decumbens]|uniref:DUF4408 domain-containing protein n=1 Tax=Urochloa decumbens TaxID=240449 RepID=A0ABC9ELQ3_9POAL